MNQQNPGLFQSLKIPLLFVAIIWGIKIVEQVLGFDFGSWGVYPRSQEGLKGILFYPLIHGDARTEADFLTLGNFKHVFSNSLPLIVLGFILLYSYRKVAARVFAIIYIGSGALVWAFARPSFHIGASGLVYGLAAFIFFSGVLRRDIRSIALSLLVAFLYGGLIWGVLPLQEGVSWEGHLFGALSGIFGAYLFRNVRITPKKIYPWQNEPEEDPNNIVEEPFWVAPAPQPQQVHKARTDLSNMKIKYDYLPDNNETE